MNPLLIIQRSTVNSPRRAVRRAPARVLRWCLVLLVALAAPLGTRAADGPGTNSTSLAISNLVIFATNGGFFSAATAVFRGSVQVLETQMYLECELLTILFDTNRAARPNLTGAGDNPGAGGFTDVDARIDTIVAETNLLMMFRDVTLLGDRAVYTKSNDVVVVTGPLVIIQRSESLMYGTNFVFNLRTGEGYPIGPNLMEVKLSSAAGGGTNTGPNLRLDGRRGPSGPNNHKRGETGPPAKTP
jgi:hypothetical protein